MNHPNDITLTEKEKELDKKQKNSKQDKITSPSDFELDIAWESANLTRIAYRDYELFNEYDLFNEESVQKARDDRSLLSENSTLYTSSSINKSRIDKYRIKHIDQNQEVEDQIKVELGEQFYKYQILTIFTRVAYEYEVNSRQIYPPKPNVDKFGFIARRELENGKSLIFIVFRGTREWTEWLKNIQLRQIPFLKRSPEYTSEVEISMGFNQIYTDYRPGTFMKRDSTSTKANETYREVDTEARDKSKDKYPLPHSFHDDSMLNLIEESLQKIDTFVMRIVLVAFVSM